MDKSVTAAPIDSFAKFIKDKRQALGKSLADVSEEVFGNRKNTYIGDIERGKRKGVTIEMMGKILSALNSEIKYQEN